MRIGIDIDDVITNTSKVIEEYVAKDENSAILQEHIKEIMRGIPSIPEIVDFGNKTYIKVFQEVTPKENACKVLKDLIDRGNEIYLITGRGYKVDNISEIIKITKKFLKDNDIQYTKIIFNAFNKAKTCLDNKIDLMIDDSVDHCEEVSKIGIKSILFTTNVNKDVNTKITRVNNWLELEEMVNLM